MMSENTIVGVLLNYIRSCTIVLNNGEIARVKAGTKEVKVKRSKTISAEL